MTVFGIAIGPTTAVILLVAVLIIFGPSKLADIGKSLGQGIKEFKKATDSPNQENNIVDAESSLPAPAQAQVADEKKVEG